MTAAIFKDTTMMGMKATIFENANNNFKDVNNNFKDANNDASKLNQHPLSGETWYRLLH